MSRFAANRHLETELARDPKIRAFVHARAEAVKAAGEAIARTFSDSGHYADSFVIEDTPDGTAVGNTDVAGHLIEFGSVNNPAHAPLRRGARAAGLDLRDTT